MTTPPRKRFRLPGIVAAAAVCALGAAGPALALDAPASASSVPGSPSNEQGPWTFTWTPVTPDAGGTITGYVGGVVAPGAPDPTDEIAQGHATAVPEGAREFRVAAVQELLGVQAIGPYRTLALTADYTPPTFTIALAPSAPNANGWYRSLRINRSCADSGAGLAGTCPSQDWATDGDFAAQEESVSDLAGNSAVATRPPFKFDATPPSGAGGQPSTPAPGALVAEEPAFAWTPGVDGTSGVERYALQYRVATGDDYITIATRTDVGGIGDYSARRDPSLPGAAGPLPERTLLRWRVLTYDRAGNARASDAREITIDSTIPPAPTITGGPAAPTRISSPTFSWTGAEDTYLWDLTTAGSETALRRGGGPATQTTITNLPDGDYTFRVSQVTKAGRPSAEATRSFKVDTTPPAAPVILVRPPFPAIAAPVFTWATEPGAYSRWTVLGEGGATVIAFTDTPATSVTLPVLPDGAYGFQVQQVDAAGNVSPATAEPFTMLAPLVPAPSPSTGTASITRLLPRQNALRLKPKAGRTLPTRSPVLQWKRGPRGTKLYNVQIFRVTSRRGATTPRITKVASLFPRTLQMRAPKRNLRPGTCYVWRVWPYTGRAFTPKPVGVSNFCVANAKVLKKKARIARAKKIERAKRLALARKAPIRR